MLALRTNRAASHLSESTPQSKPGDPASGVPPPSELSSPSTTLQPSSTGAYTVSCGHSRPKYSAHPTQPTSHAPGSAETLCTCSSATPEPFAWSLPPDGCCSAVRAASKPILSPHTDDRLSTNASPAGRSDPVPPPLPPGSCACLPASVSLPTCLVLCCSCVVVRPLSCPFLKGTF